MRFGRKTQVAASLVSFALFTGTMAGCAAGPTPAQEQMATRVEAAASKAEMAASKAEQAAKNAADAAAKAQAAADKAEAMFHKGMRK